MDTPTVELHGYQTCPGEHRIMIVTASGRTFTKLVAAPTIEEAAIVALQQYAKHGNAPVRMEDLP